MALWSYPVVLVCGVVGGIVGSVAGLASLVTYPTLLAVGLGPLAANVSNTVALIFNGAGATSASRYELAGQGASMRVLIPLALAGGAVGAVLLLAVPGKTFAFVVPWLIAVGSLTILLPRRAITSQIRGRHELALYIGTFLISIYCGYFGAAAGVLVLSLLLSTTLEPLPRSNAAKNLICMVGNAVAAVLFIALGPVRWAVVLPLSVGFFIGGRAGPAIVRRVSPRPLAILIALAGMGLATVLGVQAYT